VGVEEPEKRERRPEDEILGFRSRLIMAVIFAAFYIGTFGPRTGVLPAVVSGILGGAVIYLLLKEIDERRKRRTRERERHRHR
jgi:hypothetical protein